MVEANGTPMAADEVNSSDSEKRQETRDRLVEQAHSSLPHAEAVVLLESVEKDQFVLLTKRQFSYARNCLGDYPTGLASRLTLSEAKRAAKLLIEAGQAVIEVRDGDPLLVAAEVADRIKSGELKWVEGSYRLTPEESSLERPHST